MKDSMSLYIVCQLDQKSGTYSSTSYNGKGSKKPAFRHLTIKQKDALEDIRIPGKPNLEIYRCVHVSNAASIDPAIREKHEKKAKYSHLKGV